MNAVATTYECVFGFIRMAAGWYRSILQHAAPLGYPSIG
jgi:hypothetical protein